ncbi:hypothetical protein Q9247_06955 [Halomonas meridiana]|nr:MULTISPECIES: hypothetical protein [Halomonas]MDK9688042.1 hypothetical protein [Halomonas sp. LC1]MDP4557416.1 hypothetical protein [Halomonas meridiana]
MSHATLLSSVTAKPETVACAWASVGTTQFGYYAAYWFSHGVPLADA